MLVIRTDGGERELEPAIRQQQMVSPSSRLLRHRALQLCRQLRGVR